MWHYSRLEAFGCILFPPRVGVPSLVWRMVLWRSQQANAHALRESHVVCVNHARRLEQRSEMAADGGSSSLQLPCVFSPKSRQYLALCAQDGRLRVWNTDSKTLHQEYVPSAHLSATCICIAWGPCRTLKVRKAAVEYPAISCGG